MEREQEVRVQGRIIRLAMLMTHYRKPLNWTQQRLDEASRIMERWFQIIEPCDDAPPDDVVAALSDDMNTVLAINLITKYAKAKNGKAVFSSMKLMGFIDGVEGSGDVGGKQVANHSPVDKG